ncbi:unnamed protein product [Onchocerca ochengi]|uniref:ATP-dependent DNA helicase n=1 Tax=Onchocerca ochengi TaxID=42157 RepID=A0A182EBZ1_ONCOC|nr:unnamed protein product [Onchocerca ochengi]
MPSPNRFADASFDVELPLASFGIAATLLSGGRTAHSALELPLNMQYIEIPTCSISKASGMGKLQNDRSAGTFSHQLLEIGNGKVPVDLTTGRISLPHNFCNLVTSKEEIFEFTRSAGDVIACTTIENRRANYHVEKYQPAKTLQRHTIAVKKLMSNFVEATILTESLKGTTNMFITKTLQFTDKRQRSTQQQQPFGVPKVPVRQFKATQQ